MSRQEFSRAVRVACVKRATTDGVIYCESCGHPAKKFEIDHINPDGLTGKPSLDNAKLICLVCHKEKTRFDVAAIAKAKRREAHHLGAKPAPARKLQGRPFQHAGKTREPKQPVPRRAMFTRIAP